MVDFATAATIGGSLLQGVGGLFGGKSSAAKAEELAWKQHQWNIDAQEHFAKNSLSWRVADARQAGLHPLAALGTNTASFSPVASVGSTDSSSSLGDKIASAGQSIGRAAAAYNSTADRKKKEVSDALTLERQKLENDLLKSQITNISRATTPSIPVSGDRLPIDGQGSSVLSGEEVIPSQRTAHTVGLPAFEAARPAPAVKLFSNADGTVSVWPSADAKKAIEDSPYEYEHIWKNRIFPWLDKTFGGYYDRKLQRREDWRRAHEATGQPYW